MNIYYYVNLVTKLKPGFAIRISRLDLRMIKSMQLVGPFGPEWDPVDQIMEKVIGSAYSIRTFEDMRTGDITFERLKQPLKDNCRTYVSPDRREMFELDFGGYYRPRS